MNSPKHFISETIFILDWCRNKITIILTLTNVYNSLHFFLSPLTMHWMKDNFVLGKIWVIDFYIFSPFFFIVG